MTQEVFAQPSTITTQPVVVSPTDPQYPVIINVQDSSYVAAKAKALGLPPVDPKAIAYKHTIDLNGAKVGVFSVANLVFIDGSEQFYPYPHPVEETTDAIASIEPTGPAYWTPSASAKHDYYSQYYNRNQPKKEPFDSYPSGYSRERQETYGAGVWNYLPCLVRVGKTTSHITLKLLRPNTGKATLDPVKRAALCEKEFYGLTIKWESPLMEEPRGSKYCSWASIRNILANFFLEREPNRDQLNKGLTKVLKGGVVENLTRLQQEDPTAHRFFNWLKNEKTQKSVSNNSLLATFLQLHGSSYEELHNGIREVMSACLVGRDRASRDYNRKEGFYSTNNRAYCLLLPGATSRQQEALSKKEWNLRKGTKEQAIGLGIDPKLYPKTLAAVESLKLPLGVFHDHGDALKLRNVEFDLWERAFKRPGWQEVLCEIAQNAARRTTYEKDITPYISFLFKIEKYLDRHTGKGPKWKTMPKFVSSQWELEMSEEAQGGTTKRRSALTPVADNDTRVLTVPYAAMAISGVRTTYCYSLIYQVFEEMAIDLESKTPIVDELSKKLNGRDDYGLMYYTLTGTSRNTGYPTFLIIFERRKSGTNVHFHRVHPCRSKEGRPTPANRLIEECYRYMAGNIRAEEILAQQGDLLFLGADNNIRDFTESKGVTEFESHHFSSQDGSRVLLIDNTAKSIKNRLGFVRSGGQLQVDHPEHEPVRLPAGTYEVRRCRSFEANPLAVWSLTID